MATKRVIGFIISLALIISPQAVRAQEEIPVDPAPVESPVSQPTQEGEGYSEPEQEDVNVADSENQSDASSPDPVVDGNGSGYLASAGMTLEEFVMKDPTEEEVNALSDVDRQAWEQAKENGILKTSITAASPESLGFTEEQAVVKDCNPERFVTCADFIYESEYLSQKQQAKHRVIHLKVKNLLERSDPFITAIVTAKFLRNDEGMPEEDITAKLTDQDKDPLTATFTIYTTKLDMENDSFVTSQGITIPAPSGDKLRHITQSMHYSAVVSSAVVIPLDRYVESKKGKIRCGRASAGTRFANCVNPEEKPTVTFSANDGFPYIARNIYEAIEKDEHPSVLTRDNTEINARRYAACGPKAIKKLEEKHKKPNNDEMLNASCDEYPFASTKEGGEGATVAWVPRAENSKQGGKMAAFLRENQVRSGDEYRVKAVIE